MAPRPLPSLIIVTGPPGAGKTTLARRLADDLKLPLMEKDAVKESLFDTLGSGEREWVSRLGIASYGLLYVFADSLLAAGQSCMLEANFFPEFSTPALLQLRERHAFTPIQIVCHADIDTLVQRYMGRIGSGERHPGHSDDMDARELETMLRNRNHTAMEIGGTVIDADTTDLTRLDYESILEQVRTVMDAVSLQDHMLTIGHVSSRMSTHPDPVRAATAFVNERFPESLCALLAGSFLRGEATSTSDLDIVIITTREDAPFRASYRAHGWPIEAFVHTTESYRRYFVADGNRPSLATMVLESVVIRDTDGLAAHIKDEARQILERGPEPLSPTQLEDHRYALTDLLDDFTGCDREEEGLFIAVPLAERAATLILLMNGRWIGHGKWTPRALRGHPLGDDPALADRLTDALTTYARTGDKEDLIGFATYVLDLAGGPLFEGYYRKGK